MLEQIDRGARQYPLTARSGPPTPAGWRSLAALRPDLLEEWHPTRNRELERSGLDRGQLGTRSERTVWWECRECGHSWQGTVRDRVRGPGSPACYDRVRRGRSLAVLRADLLAELDQGRNAGLEPSTVGVWSHRKVWWRCGECGHEWRADIMHRAQRDQGLSCVWAAPLRRVLRSRWPLAGAGRAVIRGAPPRATRRVAS
jgi:hypothetical protein